MGEKSDNRKGLGQVQGQCQADDEGQGQVCSENQGPGDIQGQGSNHRQVEGQGEGEGACPILTCGPQWASVRFPRRPSAG